MNDVTQDGELTGLTSEEAARRLAQQGENVLPEKRERPIVKLLRSFWGPIPWMIEAAGIVSAAVARWEDFAIIVAMLVINSVVRFWEEYKADRAIEALKEHLAPDARVLRDGKWQVIPARQLVAGDVVRLKLGDIVPADANLGTGEYLVLDESALTGESLPVQKGAGELAYSGSVVRQGEMVAEVAATGAGTYFGKTAALVETAGAKSHFQQAVLRIGNFLILVTIALVVLILAVALFRHAPWTQTLLFALVLTVAAIPVALPAVLSVTMAVGASRLASMKAIVSRLVSIEEMAGMDVLCSDKTGTLTQNKLTLEGPVTIGAESPDELVLMAALVSRSGEGDAIDDAVCAALPDPSARDAYEEVRFTPFDPVRKMAEVDLRHAGRTLHVAKGAPQVILDHVDADEATRRSVDERVNALAQRGFRTLAVDRAQDGGRPELLGLLPLLDPPREDSKTTLEQAERMGLSVRMVTGDHTAIAREIAGELGLGTRILTATELFGSATDDDQLAERIESADGFAQVFPEHKYKIVRALQKRGHIVGMTGDGVNDAPALKQADMGIAVSGATEAARAAADLVLTAPGLSVIGRAVEEARKIFERMQSYTVFRIAETVRVLLFMTLSILVFNFYPVTAVMIVLLAILNDFPIMMIAYDNASVAPKPLRWDMRRTLTISGLLGVLGVVATFLLFWYVESVMGLGRPQTQTLMFLKLLVAGHLTIYLTRARGFFWQRPWPSWKLVVAAETTQVIGTLAAVYGWLVVPIGWKLALLVWGYALAWFVVNGLIKVAVEHLLDNGLPEHDRHMARVHADMHTRR